MSALHDPVAVVLWCQKLWLSAIVSMIVYGLLRGAISTKGLLLHKLGQPGTATSVQLVALSIGAAAAYAVSGLQSIGQPKLPEISDTWLALLGGSQLLFLAPKLLDLIGLKRS